MLRLPITSPPLQESPLVRRRVRPAIPVRYPALPVAVLLIIGILLHDGLPVLPWLWLLWTACFALAAFLAPSPGLASACLALAILSCGVTAAQLARYQFPADDIALYVGDTPRLAEVELTLSATPRLLRTVDEGRPRPPKHVTLADVTAVHTWDGWQPTQGQALLQFDSPVPTLAAGDRLRVFGLIERPGEAMNPGQFDFAAYYRTRRTLVSLSIDGPGNVEVIGQINASLLEPARERVRAWLLAGFDAPRQEDAALLRAMLLGERDPAMSDVREAFRKSGTSHYLAISGLHVAIVGGVIFSLVRVLGAGPRLALLAAGVTVAAYGLLAQPSPPVVRATVIALLFGLGLVGGRRGPGLQMLGLAACFVLLLNPLDLYRAGFQLSFVTVLGLMIFSSALLRGVGGSDGTRDVLRLQREPRLIRVTHWLDARFWRALTAAVVAWVVSMPLVAVHFEQFNPWAIPASLAAGPFVMLSLVAGVAKIALTALFPAGEEAWATLAAWPVAGMRIVVDWFAARPAADVPLPQAAPWLVVGFYASLIPLRYRFPTPSLTWISRTPLATAVVLIFIAPFTGSEDFSRDGALRVTVLAVGAGQCVVVETPGGRVAMLDAGSMSLGDPVEKAIAPFLRTRGHTRVDLLALSHANFDHYGGAAAVVKRYDVDQVFISETFATHAAEFPSGQEMLDELVHLDRPPQTLRPGDVIPLGRQTILRVLWPPQDHDDLEPNDASLVLKLEHAGRSILFPGDIQSAGMAGILASTDADASVLQSDVLIAPHHGSSELITPRFVEAVDPAWIVSSNGRALSRKQQEFEQMTGGRPLLRTHETGAVTIDIDEGGTVHVSGFLRSRPRGLRVAE